MSPDTAECFFSQMFYVTSPIVILDRPLIGQLRYCNHVARHVTWPNKDIVSF